MTNETPSAFQLFSSEPLQHYFFSILTLSDAVMFLIYATINVFIWPSGAFAWCLVPKLFWTVALYQLHTDRIRDLLTNLLLSSVTNWLYVTLNEEILLALFTGAVEGADRYSALDIFISVNLDIVHICRLAWYTVKETVGGLFASKPKTK